MLLQQIIKAKTESSVFCIGAQQHKFNVIYKKKASFHFTNVYQCQQCGEIVKRQYKRVENGLQLAKGVTTCDTSALTLH